MPKKKVHQVWGKVHQKSGEANLRKRESFMTFDNKLKKIKFILKKIENINVFKN